MDDLDARTGSDSTVMCNLINTEYASHTYMKTQFGFLALCFSIVLHAVCMYVCMCDQPILLWNSARYDV